MAQSSRLSEERENAPLPGDFTVPLPASFYTLVLALANGPWAGLSVAESRVILASFFSLTFPIQSVSRGCRCAL